MLKRAKRRINGSVVLRRTPSRQLAKTFGPTMFFLLLTIGRIVGGFILTF